MYEGRAYEEVKLDGMRKTIAARLTEAILLGTIALRRPGERLEWDADASRFTNVEEANALLRRSALLLLDLFMTLVILTLPFTLPGDPVFTIGGFTATDEGLWRSATIALKANTVLLVSLAMLARRGRKS